MAKQESGSDAQNSKELPAYQRGRPITPEEIRQVLMDEGYSATKRTSWIREVLASVQSDTSWENDPEKDRLIAEIKAVLGEQQEGKPLADDVL